jgi:tyrosyl-tRNA synthetase
MESLNLLRSRGFVKQCSNEAALQAALATGPVVFYVGFDPTADSLHVGSLVPIMAMAQLQKDGHVPICIIGGGTARIGDPSGKTEMRKMLTVDEIQANAEKVRTQLKRYLAGAVQETLFVNNADWFAEIRYIDFLRDIGRYFKVNEMIRSESAKQRLERQEGLSFIEFNYQLLQAYDFLILNKKYGCLLQMGGDDQWGNILAGTGLVRQVTKNEVFALTFPLLETATGKKMGKTESGAIWLDAKKTSPFDFYQYWINTDDRDVIKFLKLFTFLPLEQILELEKLQGAELRTAKELLAYEATRLAHGQEEADAAANVSKSLFSSANQIQADIPCVVLKREKLGAGIQAAELLQLAGFATSKSAARRLIEQGGAYLNNERLLAFDTLVTTANAKEGVLLLRQGKKNYKKVVLE